MGFLPGLLPFPLPRRWSSRIVLAAGAAWSIWLGFSTLERQSALAELRAQGLPVTLEALLADYDPPAAERNPVPAFEAAWRLIDTKSPEWVRLSEWRVSRVAMTAQEREEWLQIQAAVATRFAPALEHLAAADDQIRPAAHRVSADFGAWSELKGDVAAGRAPADPYSIVLPHLNDVRTLGRLLAADARTAAGAGDGERALRQVIRLLGLSDALASEGHCIVDYLVAIGLRVLACETIVDVAPHLDGSPVDLRVAVSALFMDGRLVSEALVRCLKGELVLQQEVLRSLEAGRIDIRAIGDNRQPDQIVRLLTRAAMPIARGDAAQMARHMAAAIAAAQEQTYPDARAILPDEAWLESVRWRDTFANILLPSLQRATEAHYRCLTESRMAAVLLAVGAYAEAHDQLPRSLEALVPRFVQAVPADAMAGNGPLRYDAEREILWSVGSDGIDGQGDASPLNPDRPVGSQWDRKDVVLRLRK